MSWKNLRLFAVIILLLANAALFAAVYTDYVNKNYYNENDIYEMRILLRSAGIEMDIDAMSSKRVDPSVHFTEYTADDVKLAVSVLSGGDVTYESGEYIAYGNGGRYVVSSDLSLEFSVDGYEPHSYISSIYEAKTVRKIQGVFEKFLNVKKISRAFGKRDSASQSYIADTLFIDNNNVYYATFYEYIDGIKTSNKIDAAISDGMVIYASGTFSLIPPTRIYSADTLDFMTFLVFEKRYFESVETERAPVLENISCEYERYTDMFGALYLIPVCRISYSDGMLRTYDMITGLVIDE